ncbi:MAG TPA: sigma-70 family RNA polymerase sigma factor [Verrucomicrobiae bacterium]|jgi:RNA polymerase sigma factor (sigma-70 family)
MSQENDDALLREFAKNHSDAAFSALVARHVNLVYSVAPRQVGNSHSAEEISQTVFIILARKAASLRGARALSSWLFQTTRLAANNFLRSEYRRQRRDQEGLMRTVLNQSESQVWPQIAPLLDAAVAELDEKDRQAIVLRFYEGRSLREVGSALGATDGAAEKRVSRALEKLRRFLARHGVDSTSAALAGAIASNSVQAAPAGLAALIAAAGGVAVSGSSTMAAVKGALKVMAWTKVKSFVAASVVLASIVAPLVVEHRAEARMAAEEAVMARDTGEAARLRAENEGLGEQVARVTLTQGQLDDLSRLRREVGALREETNAVAQLREENKRLRTEATQSQPLTPIQIKEKAMARVSYNKNWLLAFILYANENNGQFPKDFEQALPFAPDDAKNRDDVSTNQFQIVYQGALTAITNAPGTIVLEEVDPWDTRQGKWAKIYGFADGHVEIRSQADNNFDAYEQQHIIPPPVSQ